MNQELLEQVLNCPSLPTLPAVAVRVIELTQKPNVSMDELAATIQNDQGLAAKILKTVNSSFYGVRRPCSTINQAIVMLGTSAVKSLALSFSLVTAVAADGSSEFDYLSYWRRGMYTAVAAKSIAHEAGLATEDEALLGGLLQDIGMVGLFHGLQRRYLHIMLEAGDDHRSLVRHELAAFELQHPDVGALMCEKWKLPPELIMPVRFHERPTAAPDEHAKLVRAVGLGNIAHDCLTLANPGPNIQRFKDRARQWFEFDADTCNTLLRQIEESTRQLSALFHIQIGAPADVESILQQAQEQLEALSHEEVRESAHGARLGSLLSDSDDADALTGVCTPKAILLLAETAFTAAQSARKSLSVIVATLDAFPALIARGGQDAADAALVETASHLQELAELLGGSISRWDNATFCLILPGIDRAEAIRTAGEIRTSLASQSENWSLPNISTPCTASVGAACMQGKDRAYSNVNQLITAAARAAEAAAATGGNCVRTFIPRLAA